jgi:DNA-binding CsgD family transcriptional regulator
VRAVLDAVGLPLAAFDPDGRPLYRTAALERLLAPDPHRARVEAAVGALARRTAAGTFPGPARRLHPLSPEAAPTREVTTPTGRYILRATVLAESPFAGAGAVLVTAGRAGGPALPTAAAVRERHGLSAREAEVALLLAEGLKNDTIADRLGLSPHTVRRHTEGVMRKLLVESRAAVASRLLAHG